MGTAGRGETAKRLIDQIRADGYPRQEEYALIAMDGAVRSSIMIDAIRKAGRDPKSPGRAAQYWFESEDMVVIDLQPDD